MEATQRVVRQEEITEEIIELLGLPATDRSESGARPADPAP